MPKLLHELPAAQQAAIKCRDVDFQEWIGVPAKYCGTPKGVDFAADVVRGQCGVYSRAEFATDDDALKEWHLLLKEFEDRKPFTA